MDPNKEAQITLWYQMYYPKVVQFFRRRLTDASEAEDLAQDVFLRMAQYYEHYDPQRCPLSTWMFAIADNCLKDYLRGHVYAAPDSLDEAAENDPAAFADAASQKAEETAELRDLIDRALSRLPENYQKAVILQYFGGYSTQEIAEELGVTPGNARTILSRAIKKMNEILQQEP